MNFLSMLLIKQVFELTSKADAIFYQEEEKFQGMYIFIKKKKINEAQLITIILLYYYYSF